MKKLTKLIMALLFIFVLTVSIPQNVVQASVLPLKYCVDFVTYNEKTKSVDIQGWALSGNGIKSVVVIVNGKTYNTSIVYRPDVYNAYKQYNNKYSGFYKSVPVTNGTSAKIEIWFIEKSGKIIKLSKVAVTSKALKDKSDKEILQTVMNGYKVYCDVYNSYDFNDYVMVNIPSGFDAPDITYSKFYRTKAPYDTPAKREEALKKYFIDYKVLSNIVDEKTKYGADKLVKKGNYYYFCAFQVGPSYYANYREVTKRQYNGNKLIATLKYDVGDSVSYKNVEFIIDNGQLKINNVRG
ncbi:MAG: hypothetical protein AB6733_12430 [Clostridiaceae bacterium]